MTEGLVIGSDVASVDHGRKTDGWGMVWLGRAEDARRGFLVDVSGRDGRRRNHSQVTLRPTRRWERAESSPVVRRSETWQYGDVRLASFERYICSLHGTELSFRSAIMKLVNNSGQGGSTLVQISAVGCHGHRAERGANMEVLRAFLPGSKGDDVPVVEGSEAGGEEGDRPAGRGATVATVFIASWGLAEISQTDRK